VGQVIAVMDVGGTSIKTGAVRFDDGGDDPRIEVGTVLPTNSNESADIVLDSLAAGADAALDVAGGGVAVSTSSRRSMGSTSAWRCALVRRRPDSRSTSHEMPSPQERANRSPALAPESTGC